MTMLQIPVQRRAPTERFHIDGTPLDTTLVDFWAWAMSDLVSNAPRGVLAEFLVAVALGLHVGLRDPWDAYDLLTTGGIRVEVKSCAYCQSWKQKAESKIIFPIYPSRTWDHESGKTLLSAEARRQADVYVFCVLAHKLKETIDPLNIGQWIFFVLPTRVLEDRFPRQKTIGLAALQKAGALQVSFVGLRAAVEEAGARSKARAT